RGWPELGHDVRGYRRRRIWQVSHHFGRAPRDVGGNATLLEPEHQLLDLEPSATVARARNRQDPRARTEQPLLALSPLGQGQAGAEQRLPAGRRSQSALADDRSRVVTAHQRRQLPSGQAAPREARVLHEAAADVARAVAEALPLLAVGGKKQAGVLDAARGQDED